GLVRLRLATGALVSIVVAIGLAVVLQRVSGEPATLVIMSAVLAMISNITVNETAISRLRVTTALLLLPAAAAVSLGTLLAPYRIIADAVFVAIMIGGVWIRRFGPRGFAVGMAAVMSYFFSQFLNTQISGLPWLVLAAAIGVGSAFLVRGFLFAENPRNTLARLVRAFRARVHALTYAVAELLDSDADDREHARRDVGRTRTRLNESALLIADQLERQDERGDLEVYVLDAELAAERLADTARHLIITGGRPADSLRRPLLAGLRSLGAATATGTPAARVGALLDAAQHGVEPLVAQVDGLGDDGQRVAFAVSRLATALAEGRKHDPTAPADETPDPEEAGDEAESEMSGLDRQPVDDHLDVAPPAQPASAGLALTTRQAIQVGVATSLAIVGGELLSPARWYWAVIAAFVVFAGTTSRGDVLTRGRDRVLGTIGGVIAGMALAFIVNGAVVPSLVLLLVCLFMAIYLVRVSPALMAFWITAVLALLYGLTGQFSIETLLLRVEETAVGAVLGMLAGFLVLPTGTRAAFGTALDTMVGAVHAVLDTSVERLLGRPVAAAPVDLARDMDAALGVLRLRTRPLDSPLPSRRGRSSYSRALRVFTSVDHYARLLARLSDTVRAPDWADTLVPAVARIRTNLDGLRALLVHTDGPDVVSAEPEVDAAEVDVARRPDGHLRRQLLVAARLLRRMDQAVVGFATDLGAPRPEPEPARVP
ncbi:MAG: FUSC family protein, partial [Pseudonocardiales bacterium]|nr:FUSC family protein [Pseudonocardiales bacterium]